jgi:hypothetical protein
VPATAAIPPQAALPSEVSTAKPGNKLLRSVVQIVVAGLTTILVLGACFGIYILLNPDANPFKGGDKPDQPKVTDSKPPPKPTGTGPAKPVTATTPVANTTPPPKPPTPTPTPPAPTPAGPTFEELRKKVQAELALATKALKLDEAAIAKQANLPHPPTPPKMTPEQITKRAAELAKQHADKTQPMDQLRAKIQQDAKEIYGPYLIGQEVFLLLRGGVGANAQVRGILREITPAAIRVGERTIPLTDLTEGDRDRLDAEKSKRSMEAYIRRKTEPLEATYQDILKKALEGFTLSGYQQTGYVKQGDQWVTQQAALKAAVDQARKAEVAKLRQQIEQRIYGGAGYKLVNNKWQK